jgi:gp16 family phage-associated protein
MKTLTPDQVKANFRARGVTISDWARLHGYKPRCVYLVLNGQHKGHWGEAHEIAVKLGIKPGSDQHAA